VGGSSSVYLLGTGGILYFRLLSPLYGLGYVLALSISLH
jgi:hypothetical protein